MHEGQLPLFPLQVVLFPGSALPLHIFEERYKLLIGRCLQSNAEFGINFVNGSVLSDVGCTAVVTSVLHRYDDGRMDIIIEGRRAYRLREYNDRSSPYLMGHVQYLDPPREEFDQPLAEDVVALYNQMVERAYQGALTPVRAADIAPGVSFLMAQKAGMDLVQRQALLELASENERLRVLRVYFLALLPRLEHSAEIERMVRNDGYLTLKPPEIR